MARGRAVEIPALMEGFRAPSETWAGLAAAAGGGGQGGFLVEPLMQIAVGRFDRGGEGGGAAAGGRFQRERNELIKDLLAGMQGGNPGRCGEAQRNPAPTHLAIAHLNAVIPITHRNREVPLGGMAVDRHLLQGCGVWVARRKAGDVGDPQTKLAGS